MRKRLFVGSILLITLAASCVSQRKQEFTNGIKQIENLNYAVGIDYFIKSWEAEEDPETARQLAKAYYKIREFEQAEEWYARLQRDGNLIPEDFLNFAEVLIANSKYHEASLLLEQIPVEDSILVDVLRLEMMKKVVSTGKLLLNSSSKVKVFPVSELNSGDSDFGVFVGEKGELLFSTDRVYSPKGNVDPSNALKSEVYGWTGRGFLNIFHSDWDMEKDKVKQKPILDEKFKSRYHVGPVFQSTDNKWFVTLIRDQKFDKSESDGKARDFTIFPEIYYGSGNSDGDFKIEDLESLPFNSAFAYSVSDPFFDVASQKLYFSSDMPGGYGGADIYYSSLIRDSLWTAPINLGERINSVGNERSPFIKEGKKFYFSSDGFGGLGGLDIHEVDFSNGQIGSITNLGSPINSSRDDFGFTFNPRETKEAFFSSDRVGGQGKDDIFFADLAFRNYMILKGKVIDKETQAELKDAVVTLMTNQYQSTFISEEDGSFSFKVPLNQEVALRGQKTGFMDANLERIKIPDEVIGEDSIVEHNLYLEKIHVGKVYQLNNIYYDYDKWDIRADAQPELLKLVGILNESPTMVIELYSHTDNRGTDGYNLKLSQKRADAAIQFLIKNGISERRLKGVGYGEEKPIVLCSEGESCTEDQHQKNRRTEFKVISY